MFYISNIVKAKTKTAKKQINKTAKHVKRGVKLAVVPHKKNGYRPHLVRVYGLLAMIIVVFSMQLGYNGAKTGNVLGTESNITATSLYNQTNIARQEAGLKSLSLSDELNKAAFMKAQDMFSKQYWAHNAPDGTQPWKWFADVGYNYDEAGENLAKGFSSTNAVMTAWLNSPEHKANITKNTYKDVGFAVVSGKLSGGFTTIVVALYATPADKRVSNVLSSVSEASPNNQASILTQFAIALQSVTPAVMAGLTLITISILVSGFAHTYRHKLSKSLKQSWYRHHHGLIKSLGLASLALIIILLYGGGQIG